MSPTTRHVTLHFQKGQTIAEFLVVSAVLVPMILMLASFANLLDVQVTATKAARFAAWEATAYQSVSAEDTKARINKLILNRDWSDFGPNQASTAGRYPSVVNLTDGVAFTDVCEGGCTNVVSGFTDNQDSTLGQAAGLGTDSLKVVPISIPLSSNSALLKLVSMTGYRSATYTDLDQPFDNLAGKNQFHINAKAPMATGGGIALSESSFTSTVADVSRGGDKLEAFENAVILGAPLINFLGFKEMEMGMGDDGTNTTSDAQSTILPAYD